MTEEAAVSQCETQSTQQQIQPSCCSILGALLQFCGLCCYVGCPPFPGCIARKLAFHPPKKGASYSVNRVDDPEKEIHGADELVDKEFVITPIAIEMTTAYDYERLLNRVKPFVVRTSNGHHLIAVKCWPSRPSFSPCMKQQVIIFTQPNSSDLGSFLQPRYVNLPQLAEIFEMDVYSFDYSGYGYSTGATSEQSIYADIRAVYEHVHKTRPSKKIVLLGYSIGTTAVVDLAATHPGGLAGVVLVAPFTSGLRLLGNQPKREKTHFFDKFVSCDKVAEIDVPVLICHGARDTVVPSEHGVELHEKLKKPVTPLIVHGADHQSILNGAYPQTFCRIHRFLKTETEVDRREEPHKGFVMF
ncbi:unnamed protein product [Cylicocyclus nassatus]|uniref:Serine aminopeptidase S33 domain-containing protein n=1 Tax=Cylicocyclus nassatus TaxID=53992 RepID=A0AA36HB18_CYLNA|nr:unnamed protein product [Cylicocyclus nassatus]